jgi:uncharacterized protein (TIGR02271 family)
MANYGTTVGYFKTQSAAETAMSALRAAGFQQNQIGVAAASGNNASSTSTTVGEHVHEAGEHVGGMWDKVKSFFDGNETVEPYAGETQKGTFNDQEITPSDSYSSEHVQHSLGGLDVSDEHSRYFSHLLGNEKGGVVLTVSAPGREDEAANIIEDNGGDVGRAASQYDYAANATPAPSTGEQNIQLYGEVLRVHKDRVSSGEVRLRKEVHTSTQTIEVPVTREELVIERVPVSGEQVAGNASFDEQEIRIPLTEERAYVDKQAVLREEVHIGKKEVADVQSFNEQVRSEDIKVDRDGAIEEVSTR